MKPFELVRHGGERLRTGPWRGDQHVAYLAPVTESPAPSARIVRHCCELLERRGYTTVVTAALSPREQAGFRAAGFGPREELHLLAHDLLDVPAVGVEPPFRLRRARRHDRPEALAVDARAFAPFWQLDTDGLVEALTATPSRRFRLVDAPDGRVVGYAVAGRAGPQGYLQRLAVDPDARRRHLGAALVADALRWMRRRGVQQAVVNTQLGNEAAVALYERLGFRLQAERLAVLERRLERAGVGSG